MPVLPQVTVWRNHLAYPSALMYWGRKRVGCRRLHVWSSHATVQGGETITVSVPQRRGPLRWIPQWHQIHHYHLDGSPLILGAPIAASNK